MCQLNIKLISVTTSLKRSQTNFTAIINTQTHTNSKNFAKIGVVLFYIIIFETEVNTGSSFGSLGHRRSLKWCRSTDHIQLPKQLLYQCHTVSEIQLDETSCGLNKQKMVATATFIKGSKK